MKWKPLLAAALLPAAGMAQDAGFFALVEPPLVVSVHHPEGPDAAAMIIAALRASNSRHLIEPTVDVPLAAADAVLFLLNDWSDAATLPFQNRLSPLYRQVAAEGPTSRGFASWERFDDGSQLGFVFVRLTGMDADCAATIFTRALRQGFDGANLTPPADEC